MCGGAGVRWSFVVAAATGCGHIGFANNDGGAGEPCSTRTFAVPAISSLTDDFSTTQLSAQWFVPQGDNCIAPSGGELIAAPPSSANNYCLAFSQASYHLTCDSFTVKVPIVTSPVLGAQTVVYFDPGDGNRLSVILEGGDLQWNTDADLGPYDAGAELWWRLREDGARVYLDTSPDGVAFANLASAPDPIPLDSVQLIIGAGNYRSVANPGTAAFRCLDLAPPCQ